LDRFLAFRAGRSNARNARGAWQLLLPVYDELRQLAAQRLTRQPT
jgi:hypothetical protein